MFVADIFPQDSNKSEVKRIKVYKVNFSAKKYRTKKKRSHMLSLFILHFTHLCKKQEQFLKNTKNSK